MGPKKFVLPTGIEIVREDLEVLEDNKNFFNFHS